MRVHELAKELKLSSKEVLERLQKLGIDAKSHMTRLDEKAVALVKGGKKTPEKIAAPPGEKRKKEIKQEPQKEAAKETVQEIRKTAKVEPKAEEKIEVVRPVPAAPVTSAVAEPIRLDFPISVGTLASRLNLRVADLIKSLMEIGVFANVNQLLSEEVACKLSGKLGILIEKTPGL